MSGLMLRLLGTPGLVTADGQYRRIGVKHLALLAYVTLEGRQRHHRRDLAQLLWPDADPAKARSNLRLTLFRIRDVLGDGAVTSLSSDRDDIWLDRTAEGPGLTVDVHDLMNHTLPIDAFGPLADITPDGCQDYGDWLVTWREQVRVAGTAQLESASRAALADGDLDRAADMAQRLHRMDDLIEASYEVAARVSLQRGDVSSARQSLTRCRETLTRELGIAPSKAISDLAASIDGDQASSAQGADDDRPLDTNPVPVPLTSFIGRAHERQVLDTVIAARKSRLLTLLGAGGSGKTRLALETARANARRFDEGAVFVALDGLRTAAEIPAAMAAALGLSSVSDAAEPDVVLRSRLGDREVLLVADNVEHLLMDGAAEMLAALVRDCPYLVVLVTSRVEMGLVDEDLYRLDGLSLPDEDTPLASLADSDAVRLFVDRAHRVDKQLLVDADTQPLIVRICRSVDGLPLGLELAASAMRDLCLEAVADLVAEHPADLVADLRDLDDRHSSLVGIYRSSTRLLANTDAESLHRLSTFRGGFPAPAAAAVVGASTVVLARLCRASLLHREPDGRFRQHELVRQLGVSVLADMGLAEDAQRRHLRHHLAMLATAAEQLNDGRSAATIAALQEEWDNIRAAWHAAVDLHEVDMLIAAAPGLVSFGELGGVARAASDLLVDALDLSRSDAERARLVAHAMAATAIHAPLEDVEPLVEQVKALTDGVDSLASIRAGVLQRWAGKVLDTSFDTPVAQAALDEAERLVSGGTDEIMAAFIDTERGWHGTRHGDFAQALPRLESAKATFIAHGHLRGMATVEMFAACHAADQFQIGRALEADTAALTSFRELGHIGRTTLLELNLGSSYLLFGAFEEAISHTTAGMDLARRTGRLDHIPYALVQIAQGLEGLGAIERAESTFIDGIDGLAKMGSDDSLRFQLLPWWRFLNHRGRLLEAELVAQEIIDRNERGGAHHLVATGRVMLAEVLAEQGRVPEALPLAETVWTTYGGPRRGDGLLHPPETLLGLHRVFAAAGDPRADAAVQLAMMRVREAALTISDPALRRSFLSRVAVCRDIVALVGPDMGPGSVTKR